MSANSLPQHLPERLPRPGELVRVRSRHWPVEEGTPPPAPGESARVRPGCADDDAQGRTIEVFWDCEIDRCILEREGWGDLAARGFDAPRRFAAFLHTLRWNAGTATDPNLFQSPFRAGIRIAAVSATALKKAGAILNQRDAEEQELLRACVAEPRFGADAEPRPCLPDFPAFAHDVLGWSFSQRGYAGTDERPIPAELEFSLPDAGETLRPDYAVIERNPADGEALWQLLGQVLDPAQDPDGRRAAAGRLGITPHGRMERMLRAGGAPAGLLCNGRTVRLIVTLRGLHAAMDRVVLDACGWRDVLIDSEFLLDYEVDEEWGAGRKPYRYRWLEVRDEVLTRLLELNAQHAAEEARAGKAATAEQRKTVPSAGRTVGRRSRASRAPEPRPLWGNSDD